MVSVHLFTEQTDLFTARWRPWCQWRQIPRGEGGGMRGLQWLKNREPGQEGDSRSWWDEQGPCPSCRETGKYVTGRWSPESRQDPGGAREILEWDPEHSRVDHSVLGVLWGKVSAPFAAHRCRGEGSWGVTAHWSGQQAPACATGQ